MFVYWPKCVNMRVRECQSEPQRTWLVLSDQGQKSRGVCECVSSRTIPTHTCAHLFAFILHTLKHTQN